MPARTCPPGYMPLLVGAARARRYRLRRVLGRAQVAGCLILIHCPDHQFVEHPIASTVELDWLAHIAIFLFYGPVVGGDVESEFPPLYVRFLELESDR